MLAKRIIPCLDVDNGRVVKGVKFVEIRDAGDPVEIARRYNEEGADEITFLDITASSDNRATMVHVVEQVASEVFIPLTVGGGIRQPEDVLRMLNAGADKVAINTAAVFNPEFVKEVCDRFGSQCIVVAIDAKRVPDQNGHHYRENSEALACSPSLREGAGGRAVNAPCNTDTSALPGGRERSGARRLSSSGVAVLPHDRWEIFTHGGRKPTGLDAVAWARKMQDYGAGEILLTSMDRDGTKIGFDNELTRAISEAVSIPVIASGGVGNLQHLVDGVTQGKADAVLAASIFHFAEYSIGEAKRYMAERGVEVRL